MCSWPTLGCGEVWEGCSEEVTSEPDVKGSARHGGGWAGCPRPREQQCPSGNSSQLGGAAPGEGGRPRVSLPGATRVPCTETRGCLCL